MAGGAAMAPENLAAAAKAKARKLAAKLSNVSQLALPASYMLMKWQSVCQ